MLDMWKALIFVSAIASCLALFVSLGLLRRLVAALEQENRSAGLDLASEAGGVAVGSMVPAFDLFEHEALPDSPADSRCVPFYDLLDVPRVVVFLSAGCPACHDLIQSLQRTAATSWMNVVAIIDGDAQLDEPVHGLDISGVRVLEQRRSSASVAFQHQASPQAFAVSTAGVVLGKSITDSAEELARLASEALHLQPGGPDVVSTPIQYPNRKGVLP